MKGCNNKDTGIKRRELKGGKERIERVGRWGRNGGRIKQNREELRKRKMRKEERKG